MFLSIIVPSYNVSPYIEKCINSLVQQDITDYEIIAVNDCSTDDTLKKLLVLEQKYNNLIVIDKEKNSGLSDTRNIGLKHAKGEYVLFVDSDDYIDNNSLSKLVDLLKSVKPEILYFGYIIERESQKNKVFNYRSEANKLYIEHDFISQELNHRNLPIPACIACYKRCFLLDNRFWFETGILHEDVRWSPVVLYKANRIYTSELMFYHYILREDSISQKKDKTKNAIDLVATCKYLFDFSKKISEGKLRRNFVNYVAMTYMKTVVTTGILNHPDIVTVKRTFPFHNVCFWQDYMKATVFAVSPRLYEKIYNFIKFNIKKDII